MTTIATVTTVGGCYSQWLPDWADGLLSQTRRPDQVAIVVNGHVDDEPLVDATVGRLRGAGLDVRLIRTPWTLNYGRARNIAVDATDTVWVHHFDVDDVLLAHALADWQELQRSADVVAFGWQRMGDCPKGPHKRLYRPHRGAQTLATKAPASGVSPFRRSLWEASPYYDGLSAGWDTALWRGFGWLGARFVPTHRPVFAYRYHADSIYNTRTSAGDPHRVGPRLRQLAVDPPADVAVVVPWRNQGDPDRQAAWRWLRRRWEAQHPDWDVIVADCDGDWNKPRALNQTIDGLDCKFLVVADADVVVDPEDLKWATLDAAVCPWVVPHGDVWRMDPTSTGRLLGSPPDGDLPASPSTHRKPYRGYPGGGLFVISRAQWDLVGGFDEQFVGWGCEDEAFAVAADTILGPHARYEGPLLHLYHAPGLRGRHPAWKANRARLDRYRQAAGDRTRMAALSGGRP